MLMYHSLYVQSYQILKIHVHLLNCRHILFSLKPTEMEAESVFHNDTVLYNLLQWCWMINKNCPRRILLFDTVEKFVVSKIKWINK